MCSSSTTIIQRPSTFQQHTVFYAFPLTDLQTISMEEAAALYYNTSY